MKSIRIWFRKNGLACLCFFFYILSGFATPALGQQLQLGVGVGVPEDHVAIINASGYYCGIVAKGKRIVFLSPGGSAFSKTGIRGGDLMEIPTVALCYKDEEASEYVGATGIVLNLQSNPSGSSVVWTIESRNIIAPDGGGVSLLNGQPSVDVKIKIPRGHWYGETIGQFVNNSPYTLILRKDGQRVAALKSQEVYCLSLTGFRQATMDATAVRNNGEAVGIWETHLISSNGGGVFAQNFILGPGVFH
jgi:hypothetical protein